MRDKMAAKKKWIGQGVVKETEKLADEAIHQKRADRKKERENYA